MARLLHVVVEPPRPCSYLDDRSASLEHRILVDGTAAELEEMLARGWRRFGPDHFRPKCAPCSACVPTRVVVSGFSPSKSQRRAERAASSLRVVVGRPRVDRARIELHAKWHTFREAARGWAPSDLDPRHYTLSFAFPHEAGVELSYWDDDAPEGPLLVGVAIADATPNALSAVYFFYDPAYARRSLGIANVLQHVELARQTGKAHVYLGFRVEGCASMQYKGGFMPAERLVGWPSDDEAPRWIPA
ncbi:MAG TPA: arginyltransferase [Byssovorax sp.]